MQMHESNYILCGDNKFKKLTNYGWIYYYKTNCLYCNTEIYRRISDKIKTKMNFCNNTCKKNYFINNNLNKKYDKGMQIPENGVIRKFTGNSWSYLKTVKCDTCGKDILREYRKNRKYYCSGICKSKTLIGVDPRRNKILDKMFDNFSQFPKKIGIKALFTREEYSGSGYDKPYKWQCITCNTIFDHWYYEINKLRCPMCTKNTNIEQKIITLLSKYVAIVTNTRSIIKPYEIDVYIPEKKVGIEANGLYWHSESMGTDSKYHLDKLERAEENGIRLIHLFADEIMFNWDIVKNRLKNILGLTKYSIAARKCVVNKITPQLKDKFLNKYHIQGKDKSNKHLGLFYKTRLVGVMTFAKFRTVLGRKHTDNCWELSRYATISHFNIMGGAGKLLSYFERTYKPKTIISYADRRWSQGNLYYKLGFNKIKNTRPSYWYTKDYLHRTYRFNFRKSVLKNKLKIFNEKLSERENMKNSGYDRIWDCGTILFKKEYL